MVRWPRQEYSLPQFVILKLLLDINHLQCCLWRGRLTQLKLQFVLQLLRFALEIEQRLAEDALLGEVDILQANFQTRLRFKLLQRASQGFGVKPLFRERAEKRLVKAPVVALDGVAALHVMLYGAISVQVLHAGSILGNWDGL